MNLEKDVCTLGAGCADPGAGRQRAGLKKTSFEFASKLMLPEHRPNIAETYKKKIESIVRKPTKVEEDEPVSACPYCGEKSPESSLDCPHCNNRIPYCIASGLKMVAHDWCICPSCRFPALHSRFPALIEAEKVSSALAPAVSAERLGFRV